MKEEKITRSENKKTKAKKGMSPIITVAIVAVVVYAIINMISSNVQYKQLQTELKEKERMAEELRIENEELSQIVKTGDTDAYVIKIAREKFGLVFKDEKVFKVSE
jgi:cell division protein FtsL